MNKRYIQLFLFLIIILMASIFYLKYLAPEKNTNKIDLKSTNNQTVDEDQNNLIKNLKYNVKFNNKNEYIIESKESELSYKNNKEIVIMKNVLAKIIEQNGAILLITADYANFDSSTYDTEFHTNVLVTYTDNLISSDNLRLDFTQNIIKIYNNVVYQGLKGTIKTDNVTINLITKNAKIFMNDSNTKVGVISN